MPLPFLLPIALGAGAAIAGVTGVAKGVKGAVDIKEANDTMKSAERLHQQHIRKFEVKSEETNQIMDKLGAQELEILKSFDVFSDTIEKIQNRPQFRKYSRDGVELPEYNKEDLKQVSIGAGVLLGGLGGAAVGTAGGFAAAGATTSAVMALGTASTGTAIASLSGAAATNATLAAIGGGAVGSSALAGGMAVGSAILGAATLGVGLLVGGLVFGATGSKLSDQADEAWSQMRKAEKTIEEICSYLDDLKETANRYVTVLGKVNGMYEQEFKKVSMAVNEHYKTDWNAFTEREKQAVQNSVLLVGMLYKMCQVKLVEQSENENKLNTINKGLVKKTMDEAEQVMKEVA